MGSLPEDARDCEICRRKIHSTGMKIKVMIHRNMYGKRAFYVQKNIADTCRRNTGTRRKAHERMLNDFFLRLKLLHFP